MTHTPSHRRRLVLALASVALGGRSDIEPARTAAPAAAAQSTAATGVDVALRAYLTAHGFTGRIAGTLEARLGRRVDRQLADLGRRLWFDPIHGLNGDNTCGGCHSPTNGFGDTQPIAIGIDNNGVVGPDRRGPRNQRRTPMAINAVFYPTLMWNSRFFAPSGNPFDNSQGFVFPAPEAMTLSRLPHLLTAQAFIPPTERTEAAGFHFPGGNDDIRREVLRRLNASAAYRQLFARVFPDVRAGAPIVYDHFARAISEFELSGLPSDLRGPTGPAQPVLDRLDPLLRTPVKLTESEFHSLVDFVRDGLLDPAARPQHLRRLIPEKLPSGLPGLLFR